MSTNLVFMSGVLSKHELRYTPKGTPVLEVTLIGKRAIGHQHIFSRADLTFYGKMAEHWANDLVAGQAYQATGRLVYEAWEADGQKASRLRVVGDELYKLENADVRQEEQGPVLYGAENRVILSGGLTADPEIRQTPLKTPVVKAALGFSIWDASARQAKSHYVELEAWRELAIQLAELKKGTPVLLEGALKTEVWEDKETKSKHYKRVLEIQRVIPLARIRPAKQTQAKPAQVKRRSKTKQKSKAA